MKIDKNNLINTIIKENRNYGKDLNGEKKYIIIFDNNIELSELIYLDDISRVIALSFDVETIYINFTNTYTKEKLNNTRINYNKFINKNELDADIYDILNNNLLISDNCLYIENVMLVDDNGNYTDILYKLNYLKILSQKTKNIIIYDKDYQKYQVLISKLGLKNIKNVNINYNIDIKSNKDIDKTRLDAISSNIDLNDLKYLHKRLNNMLYNEKKYELDSYNQLNSSIEYNIIEILNDYKETIFNVSKSLNLNFLINYINKLFNITKEYINNENLNLTVERVNLLNSINIILNNILELLGIILIY